MKQPHFLYILQIHKNQESLVGHGQNIDGNPVSGLWNRLYLKNKQMKLIDFLRAGTNSCKLKDD